MTQQYDNTNKGVLFINDYKEGSKQPDYKGKLDVGGKEYELAAWTREKKDGSGKFLSVSIQEPYDKDREQSGDSEIPF